jgi:hypothetical protein
LAALTPTQQRVRGQIEALIRLAAPALDLMLAGGDRLSRIVDAGSGPSDYELTPPVRSQRAIAGRAKRG